MNTHPTMGIVPGVPPGQNPAAVRYAPHTMSMGLPRSAQPGPIPGPPSGSTPMSGLHMGHSPAMNMNIGPANPIQATSGLQGPPGLGAANGGVGPGGLMRTPSRSASGGALPGAPGPGLSPSGMRMGGGPTQAMNGMGSMPSMNPMNSMGNIGMGSMSNLSNMNSMPGLIPRQTSLRGQPGLPATVQGLPPTGRGPPGVALRQPMRTVSGPGAPNNMSPLMRAQAIPIGSNPQQVMRAQSAVPGMPPVGMPSSQMMRSMRSHVPGVPTMQGAMSGVGGGMPIGANNMFPNSFSMRPQTGTAPGRGMGMHSQQMSTGIPAQQTGNGGPNPSPMISHGGAMQQGMQPGPSMMQQGGMMPQGPSMGPSMMQQGGGPSMLSQMNPSMQPLRQNVSPNRPLPGMGPQPPGMAGPQQLGMVPQPSGQPGRPPMGQPPGRPPSLGLQPHLTGGGGTGQQMHMQGQQPIMPGTGQQPHMPGQSQQQHMPGQQQQPFMSGGGAGAMPGGGPGGLRDMMGNGGTMGGPDVPSSFSASDGSSFGENTFAGSSGSSFGDGPHFGASSSSSFGGPSGPAFGDGPPFNMSFTDNPQQQQHQPLMNSLGSMEQQHGQQRGIPQHGPQQQQQPMEQPPMNSLNHSSANRGSVLSPQNTNMGVNGSVNMTVGMGAGMGPSTGGGATDEQRPGTSLSHHRGTPHISPRTSHISPRAPHSSPSHGQQIGPHGPHPQHGVPSMNSHAPANGPHPHSVPPVGFGPGRSPSASYAQQQQLGGPAYSGTSTPFPGHPGAYRPASQPQSAPPYPASQQQHTPSGTPRIAQQQLQAQQPFSSASGMYYPQQQQLQPQQGAPRFPGGPYPPGQSQQQQRPFTPSSAPPAEHGNGGYPFPPPGRQFSPPRPGSARPLHAGPSRSPFQTGDNGFLTTPAQQFDAMRGVNEQNPQIHPSLVGPAPYDGSPTGSAVSGRPGSSHVNPMSGRSPLTGKGALPGGVPKSQSSMGPPVSGPARPPTQGTPMMNATSVNRGQQMGTLSDTKAALRSQQQLEAASPAAARRSLQFSGPMYGEASPHRPGSATAMSSPPLQPPPPLPHGVVGLTSQPIGISSEQAPSVQDASGQSPSSYQSHGETGADTLNEDSASQRKVMLGTGQAIIRLLEWSEYLNREEPDKSQLSYWTELVSKFFYPSSLLQMTLWKENQRTECKMFKIGVPIIPRFFLVSTQSGVKTISISLDGARETMQHGVDGLLIRCPDATWTFRYSSGYNVVLRGPMQVWVRRVDPEVNGTELSMSPPSGEIPSSALKFVSMSFEATSIEKFLNVETFGKREQKTGSLMAPPTYMIPVPNHHAALQQQQQQGPGHSPHIVNRAPNGETKDDGKPKAEEDAASHAIALQRRQHAVDGDAPKWEEPRLFLEKLWVPGEPVNAFGIPQATMRCLELAESVSEMSDLIDYSREKSLGPKAALVAFAERIRLDNPIEVAKLNIPRPGDPPLSYTMAQNAKNAQNAAVTETVGQLHASSGAATTNGASSPSAANSATNSPHTSSITTTPQTTSRQPPGPSVPGPSSAPSRTTKAPSRRGGGKAAYGTTAPSTSAVSATPQPSTSAQSTPVVAHANVPPHSAPASSISVPPPPTSSASVSSGPRKRKNTDAKESDGAPPTKRAARKRGRAGTHAGA